MGGVTYATMSGGEDYLMRPVLRGMCKIESLKSGEITLEDIAMLNEAIDVMDENTHRASEAARR